MKKPIIEIVEHSAAEEDPGWYTVASLQTNGKDIAVRIAPVFIPILNQERVERLIFLLKDALYRVRPDLRQQ